MEEASKDKKVYKIKCSLIGKYKVGKSKFFDRFIHEKTSQELMELKQEQYLANYRNRFWWERYRI